MNTNNNNYHDSAPTNNNKGAINRIIAVIATLVIAFMVWRYADILQGRTETVTSNTTAEQQLSLGLTNTTVYRYNSRGELASKLSGKTIKQFVGEKTLHIEKPAAAFFTQSQQSWQINAEQAYLENNILTLHNNIQAQQLIDNYSINSQTLTVDQNQRSFHTSSAIELNQPSGRLSAIGAHGKLDQEHIFLEQQVRGVLYAEP